MGQNTSGLLKTVAQGQLLGPLASAQIEQRKAKKKQAGAAAEAGAAATKIAAEEAEALAKKTAEEKEATRLRTQEEKSEAQTQARRVALSGFLRGEGAGGGRRRFLRGAK
jgi:hypothetical protein